MYCMVAFNRKEDIVMYWDEPAVTMDYPEHKFSHYSQNWTDNLIENIVLSSATLLNAMTGKLLVTLEPALSKYIVDHDCNKSIPLVNKADLLKYAFYGKRIRKHPENQNIVANTKHYCVILISARQYVSLLKQMN